MKMLMTLMMIGLFAAATGCNESKLVTGSGSAGHGSGTMNSKYLAASEPPGAIPVGEARQNAKDKDAVTLVGRIGGSSNPFIDGLAAFTIVDAKVTNCDDEGCACEAREAKDNIAMVKIVDASGKPVADDARSLLNVQKLSMVVVQGTANRDDQGNLSVLADKVFVRPTN